MEAVGRSSRCPPEARLCALRRRRRRTGRHHGQVPAAPSV